MEKTALNSGITLLGRPVLPLVSMVQFLYLTGPFDRVEEVVAQLPAPIETGHAFYEDPAGLLDPYLDLLRGLHKLKDESALAWMVEDPEGVVLDRMTAVTALVGQQVLTRELEAINSLLCGPCGCTLCCIGPDEGMEQEFFEIPLAFGEEELFRIERLDLPASRAKNPLDDPPLVVDNRPFYWLSEPRCIRFAKGWSLILPRAAQCPALDPAGRCRIYPRRPEVCRRPQIFAYLLEQLPPVDGLLRYRLRQSLLAVTDCPYVRALREEIAAYSAACELETVFSSNKG